MAFFHALGNCPRCGEWGALWRDRFMQRRKFFLFGPVVSVPVYRCDECGGK